LSAAYAATSTHNNARMATISVDLRPIRQIKHKTLTSPTEKMRSAPSFLSAATSRSDPLSVGPKDRYYIIDHHHLARALHDKGVKHVAVTVIASLISIPSGMSWTITIGRIHLWKAVAGLTVICQSQ
jgi:hypothetical protein